jgi:tripartite-type tricarboxylate transporter receptor subunit TctC
MHAIHIALAALAAVLSVNGSNASAHGYPSRPISLVVSTAAGASSDVLARILADHMRGPLGQPVVIENVPGAEGTIGMARVARAPGDGYTLILGGSSSNVINPAIRTLSFDAVNDFQPIARLADAPLIVATSKKVPANNLRDLTVWLNADPGKATQGIVGATSRVAGAFLQNLTGVRFQFVPYRSFPAALADLTAGHIDFMLTPAGQAIGPARAGEIKALAVTSATRLAASPEIPTVDEAGLPGFYMSLWLALFAPRTTPKPVIAKLNTAVTAALADTKVRQRLGDIAYVVPPPDQQTPDALAALHKAEIEKWWPIIKAAGIKAE